MASYKYTHRIPLEPETVFNADKLRDADSTETGKSSPDQITSHETQKDRWTAFHWAILIIIRAALKFPTLYPHQNPVDAPNDPNRRE